MSRRRDCVRALVALAVFWAMPLEAAEAANDDPALALVSRNAQARAKVYEALARRYSQIIRYRDLDSAREGAEGSLDITLAVVAEAEHIRGTEDVYGSPQPICDFLATIELVELESGRLIWTATGEGRGRGAGGRNCERAAERALPQVLDRLLVRLDDYWDGILEQRTDRLWVELPDHWNDAKREELTASLLDIRGIRELAPEPDAHLLEFSIYREPNLLAREIDALESVTVTRSAGRRVVARQPAALAVDEQSSRGGEKSLPEVPDGEDAGPVGSYVGRKWALVVGVSSFQDEGVPPLSYPAKDARAFAETLVHPDVGRFTEDETVVLLDEEATTRRIKMELDYLAHMTQPEDLFVFFISTHAVPGAFDTAGEPFFVTHDTEKRELYATAFSMRDLVKALNLRIRAQTVVGFLDACYTGQIVDGDDDLRESAEPSSDAPGFHLSWSSEWTVMGAKSISGDDEFLSGGSDHEAKRLVLISSSDGDQPSWESEELGYGFFTYYLVDALRRSRGQATVDVLFTELEAKVRGAVLRERGTLQEPRLFVSRDADFTIGYAQVE